MAFPEGFEDEVGDIIKKARSALDLTLAELAQKAGLDADHLAAVEAYDALPAADEAERLAALLELAPAKLARLARGAWEPPQVSHTLADGTEVARIPFASMNVNAYLLVPAGGGGAVLVDGGMGANALLAALEASGRRLSAVLITHSHWDHVAGLPKLLAQAAGDAPLPVYLHCLGRQALGELAGARLETIRDGEQVAPGRAGAPAFTARAVPGHAQDSLVFVGAGAAFTGDALFAASVGGTPDGSAHRRLLVGVRETILSLPDETVLFPGHGTATSVAAEKRCNPFFPEFTS